MDFFKKSNAVRLRSRHGKYLFADDDECAVSQSREGSKRNVVWTVEIEDDDPSVIKLKSCYNCYLTATNVPFLLGWTGKKVLQMKLVDSESSVIWEPIRDGYSVKLRTRAGNFLRANGSIPPWRNSITHDSAHKQDWFLWEVVPMGNGLSNDGGFSQNTSFASNTSFTTNTSFTSNAPISQQSSFASNASFKEEPPTPKPNMYAQQESPTPKPKVDGRIIHYTVAEDDSDIPDDFESEFVFRGHDVKMLTERLKEETGIDDDLYVCAKNHFTNKLFPLVLHLPPQNAPMYVVVVKASSKLARTLPGVGAETVRDAGDTYSRSSSLDYE
ncbi:hypothetical protein GOP47_0021741 [Adiantum capillus-veneris]|uniref:DUF569 domain-containing protein n=1 Tax=Adiantum capillus-veneris TaxID=13818 RepID=A0A9D4U9T2_ADICA|nr:hypothetical protein GOP47_0021741 [Adiantum capillus-veneris]